MHIAPSFLARRKATFSPQVMLAALLSAMLTAFVSLYLANRNTAVLVHDMAIVMHQAILRTQQQDDCDGGTSDDANCVNDDGPTYDPPPSNA